MFVEPGIKTGIKIKLDNPKELGADIAEMIEDATPEEKTLLKTKLSNLATRIA